MQQIGDWLKKLGMSEYEQRFAENRVDFSVLRDLTDQDLKDIGVVLGDRRKILRAIGELDSGPTATQAVPPVTAAPITADAASPAKSATVALVESAGERRYLTVM